jgi:hypothetical protein
MTLERTEPQQVTSSDGWQVASAGREEVLYREGGREVRAGVDRGPVTRLYVDDLDWVDPGTGDRTALSEQERANVLPRLVEGLEFMGMELELFSRA